MSSARVVNEENGSFTIALINYLIYESSTFRTTSRSSSRFSSSLVNDVFRQMTFNHFPHQTVYRATDSSNLL